MSEEKTLPKGWKWVKLGEVCEKVFTVKRSEQKLEDEIKYLDIGGIDNQTNKIVSHKLYKWKDAPSRAQQIIRKNDILFSTVRTYLKNIALVESSIYDNEIASSGFTVIRGKGKEKESHFKYLFYYSLSRSFLEPLHKLQTGSSYPAVRDKDVFNQIIPLPSFTTQQAIVSKIEELFSELDNGIAQLKTAQQQLKTYRQAVLKHAFEGRLTNKNVKDGELPEGWIWVKLGDITSVLGDGLHGTPQYTEDGEYFFINGNNLDNGRIVFKENTKRVSVDEYKKYKKPLTDRTILVSINGTIGNLAFYNNEKVILGKSACYFNISDSINKHYIKLLLSSEYFLRYAVSSATGSTIKNVPLKAMREFNVPLPNIEEQEQIVQEIERRLSVADKLQETIDTALAQSESLRQSILKQAFEGKLVRE